MVGLDDIVISGIGCVTPIGIGREALRQSLLGGRSGTRVVFHASSTGRVLYGAPIENFDGKDYVTPRKALKLMGRDVQLSYAAAHLAWEDAGLSDSTIDPNRVGVVFGSEIIPTEVEEVISVVRSCSTGPDMDSSRWGSEFSKGIFPLWMLRYLPNMPPCHVAIAIDARGPNNTIAMEEVSGLLALSEAIGIMQRGDADMMVVGAIGSRVTPTRLAFRMPGLFLETESPLEPDTNHCRPFEMRRGGIVPSEAAVVLIVERRRSAVARKARIYGQVRSVVSRFGRPRQHLTGSSVAIAQAATAAMRLAGVCAEDLACVSAQGYSQSALDQTEAVAISQFAPNTPVSAYSSYLGTAGAASSLLQLASAILATSSGQVLPIAGFSQADPACPVQVCQQKQATQQRVLLQLGFTYHGAAAATIVEC
jgi:3-oxoacyl-[acyl-carrier-protein] synthase II